MAARPGVAGVRRRDGAAWRSPAASPPRCCSASAPARARSSTCSLLATAMWQLSPLVVASRLFGFSKIPQVDRAFSPNPLVNVYRTADDRFISLILLQSDRYWPELCAASGIPSWPTTRASPTPPPGPRTRSPASAALDAIFEAEPLAHWNAALADFSGVWACCRRSTSCTTIRR